MSPSVSADIVFQLDQSSELFPLSSHPVGLTVKVRKVPRGVCCVSATATAKSCHHLNALSNDDVQLQVAPQPLIIAVMRPQRPKFGCWKLVIIIEQYFLSRLYFSFFFSLLDFFLLLWLGYAGEKVSFYSFFYCGKISHASVFFSLRLSVHLAVICLTSSFHTAPQGVVSSIWTHGTHTYTRTHTHTHTHVHTHKQRYKTHCLSSQCSEMLQLV